ncbi:hypothetical protein B9Z49_08630 [Limnohabitans sp. 2KL-51]|nr:hypothetical protein B9Z49_08630 [Limnohabitans sp. 2KL-51]
MLILPCYLHLPRVFALPAQLFSSPAGELHDRFLQLIERLNRLAKVRVQTTCCLVAGSSSKAMQPVT